MSSIDAPSMRMPSADRSISGNRRNADATEASSSGPAASRSGPPSGEAKESNVLERRGSSGSAGSLEEDVSRDGQEVGRTRRKADLTRRGPRADERSAVMSSASEIGPTGRGRTGDRRGVLSVKLVEGDRRHARYIYPRGGARLRRIGAFGAREVVFFGLPRNAGRRAVIEVRRRPRRQVIPRRTLPGGTRCSSLRRGS